MAKYIGSKLITGTIGIIMTAKINVGTLYLTPCLMSFQVNITAYANESRTEIIYNSKIMIIS